MMPGGDGAAPPQEAPAAPPKVVCIAQQPDGTFSVYEEAPEPAEAAPMMGEAPGEAPEAAAPAAQPAASLDEALNLARQMFQDDGRTAEEQMLAGYTKGAPAAGRPSPKQVFGE